MVNDIAIQDFVNSIREQPTETNNNYSAVVSRIDDEGVAWVHLQGSDKETPVASTASEVKRGDRVTVTWKNNGLYIGGNYTNPSAGITRVNRVEGVANNAMDTADEAFIAANSAVQDAERARVAAESAEADAESAASSAQQAQQSASSAGENASRAQAASEAAQAAALASITTDTIYYLATSQGSGITRSTSGWTTSVQTMTSTNKYLWTYHTYTTAGGTPSYTEPVITGTYGEKGADGTSVTILGSYNTLAELQQAHPTGARGDAYMVSGDLYVWNGSAWENVGQIQGPQGATGPQGASVTVSSVAYAVTTTDSEPQTYPYSTVPTVPEGSWLWTKTTYSDGTSSAITKAKQGVSGTDGTNGRDGRDGTDGRDGADGRDGTDGADGTDGVSVTAVQPQYYLSQSDSSATGGSWSTTLSYVIGKFIWTRDYITYSNGTHSTSTAIYNEALTQSCYNAATALGLVQEQQEYFWHDSLGAHVLSSTDTTGIRYRTDIKGAGFEINKLAVGGTETSVAMFGATGSRVGNAGDYNTAVLPNSIQLRHGTDSIFEASANAISAKIDSTKAEVFKVEYASSKPITHSETFQMETTGGTTCTFDTQPTGGTLVDVEFNVLFTGFESNPRSFVWSNLEIPSSGIVLESNAWSWQEASGYNGEQLAGGVLSVDAQPSTTDIYFSVSVQGVTISEINATITWNTSTATKDEVSFTFGDRATGTYKGLFSSSFGDDNVASGDTSFAEGRGVIASGYISHAEGYKSEARGAYAHAQNNSTIASGNSQTAMGQYNKVAPNGTYLVIGNGAKNARHNAFTFDKDGHIISNEHASHIGSINAGNNSASVGSSNSPSQLSGDISLTAGVYVLLGEVTFPANATGVRHLEWATTDASTRLITRVTTGAVQGGFPTRIQVSDIIFVPEGETRKIHLSCYQNSNTTMTVEYYWSYVRIL